MTRAVAAYGQMTWESIELGNELRPTILGKSVKLILLDNKSDKVESANAASRLIEKEGVVAAIGAVASGNTLSAGPIFEKAGVPLITPASTSPLVTQGRKFIFRACFIDPFQGQVAAKFAINNLKAKKAAVLADIAQDYCIGLANFFEKSFQKMGGKIVVKTFCKTGDQDFTAQLTAIKAQNPDVIYIPNYYTEDALIAKQAREMGITAPFLSGDGAQAPQLVEIGGKAVEGMYYTTHFNEKAVTNELGKKYVKAYREKYNKTPNALGALGFDAYYMLLDSIEKAGVLDSQKIRDALAATKNFKGVTGTIIIDENGNAVKSAVIETVKNGKFDFVTVVNP